MALSPKSGTSIPTMTRPDSLHSSNSMENVAFKRSQPTVARVSDVNIISKQEHRCLFATSGVVIKDAALRLNQEPLLDSTRRGREQREGKKTPRHLFRLLTKLAKQETFRKSNFVKKKREKKKCWWRHTDKVQGGGGEFTRHGAVKKNSKIWQS